MLETLAVVLFLATVGNRLVEALVTPLYEKFGWDKFSIMYVAWVLTSVLAYLSGANLFVDYFSSAIVGKLLTGLVAGGGANFIHDIFDKEPKET